MERRGILYDLTRCWNREGQVTMKIRIFPLRNHQLELQNICDSMNSVSILFGAGLPSIDATMNGFAQDVDGTQLGEPHKWMTAYLEVGTERQAQIVLARLRNQVRSNQK